MATAALGIADDDFALALSPQNDLVVFGPKGERVTDISVPTVSQSVTAGNIAFQVSYGRDANNVLTAIIAPSSTSPAALHYSVLGKKIVADRRAVVTLTFPSANRVIVDPGYVGTVTVDSNQLHHRDLVDSTPAPAPRAAAPAPAPASVPPAAPAVVDSAEVPPLHHQPSHPAASAPTPAPSAPSTVRTPAPVAEASVADEADDTVTRPFKKTYSDGTNPYMAIMPPPLVGSVFAFPPPPHSMNSSAPGSLSGTYYWSEPVTPPNGPPPSVGRNEMKVVEVVGPVYIQSANGQTKPAVNGAILPSGSTLVTDDGGSAAVFIGGVNSARFLPRSEATISHNMDGSVRHTSIDLKKGAVFSRVGRRTGETEDYKVKTSEGVAAARGTEFADARFTGSDGKSHHYVFVAKGSVQLLTVGGQAVQIVAGKLGELGMSAMPPASDMTAIFNQILKLLQPFNVKLLGVLHRMQDGTASAGDLAFYKNIVDTYVERFLPTMIDIYEDYINIYQVIPAARRAVNQDLVPFGTNPLTPY